MKKAGIIEVRHLIPGLYSELLELLQNLSSDEWNYPTSNPQWTVKDIAAHILDTDLRRLSFQRDKLVPPKPGNEVNFNLVEYINYLNYSWVETSKRLSPQVLIDLLKYSGMEIQKLFISLEMNGEAIFGVSWAGEDKSENWFDIAREYTEKWYHLQQIREAVGKPLMTEQRWIHPLIDTFVRGLPNIYQIAYPDKKELVVFIEIEDISDGKWVLRKNDCWELLVGETSAYTSKIIMNADTAWRMFSKNITKDEAKKRISIEGDILLGLLVIDLTTFVK